MCGVESSLEPQVHAMQSACGKVAARRMRQAGRSYAPATMLLRTLKPPLSFSSILFRTSIGRLASNSAGVIFPSPFCSQREAEQEVQRGVRGW